MAFRRYFTFDVVSDGSIPATPTPQINLCPQTQNIFFEVKDNGDLYVNDVQVGAGGSSIIQRATVSLTSNQIKAIGGTPITVVAAPGVGKVNNLISWAMQYKAGATPYTVGAVNLAIYYASDTTNSMGSENLQGFIDQASDRIFPSIPSGGLGSPATSANSANQALVITTTDASSPTLGNGTLIITVYYSIDDLS